MNGLGKALNEGPRTGQRRNWTVEIVGTLVASAYKEVPDGHAHWTLRLLGGKMVELGE